MISIVITSFREPKTIGKAIESFIFQDIKEKYELIVVAPDEKTLDVARKYAKKHKQIKIFKDPGKGKPAALNLAVSKAKGDILVLTDGDVYVDKNALNLMVEKFKNKEIGAVSGNPVSLNPKNDRYGFWAFVLTNVANEIRIENQKKDSKIICSGYLFAIRKELFPRLPENLLSEDGYISEIIYEKGYKIEYAPDAKVYVKYPTNFSDWIKQKKRSAGGYNQIGKILGKQMRSFSSESSGAFRLFKYVSGIRQLIWLFELLIARFYLWILIYLDISIKNKTQKELWQRVESTK